MRVSVITPTRNRQHFLPGLVQLFRAQDHDDKELVILDDSPTPATDVAALTADDPQITYRFSPEQISIGEKRNLLIDSCTGEHIVQFDDDDYYSPHYLTYMSEKLERVDFYTLNAWYVLGIEADFFGYWDTRVAFPTHHLVGPGQSRMVTDAFLHEPSFLDNAWGFGFTYAFRKEAAAQVRFADQDWGEDYEFFVRLRDAGFTVEAEPDTSGLVLHMMHRGNTSRVFPQYRLPMHHLGPTFGSGLGEAFRGIRHRLSESYREPVTKNL